MIFLHNSRRDGYVRSQVDDLLRRVAAELDAGRPVRPLINSVGLRMGDRFPGRKNCDVDAVDWFLGQLRSEGGRDAGGFTGDPWHDILEVTQFGGRGPGDGLSYRAFRKHFAQECARAWSDFGTLPGARLQWLCARKDNELRDEAGQQLAALRRGWARAATASAAGRTFTFRSARAKWKGRTRRVTELVDDAGLAAFNMTGENVRGSAQARIFFPDNQVLRFMVRGIRTETAIMTAVDQTGARVARYRNTATGFSQRAEIIVNPQWDLTTERLLAVLISAPWLSRYFASEQQ